MKKSFFRFFGENLKSLCWKMTELLDSAQMLLIPWVSEWVSDEPRYRAAIAAKNILKLKVGRAALAKLWDSIILSKNFFFMYNSKMVKANVMKLSDFFIW